MTRKNHSLFICLIVMLIGLCSLLGVTPQIFASAEGYSNVLNDLQRDSTFDASAYPIKEDDHSLQLVTIAESDKGELFVYVYQPSASHKATSISISTEKKGKEFKLYSLNYINKFKALYKYSVKDFEVTNGEIRYYEFASIYRAWVEGVDKSLATGETISEVSYSVGKQFLLTDDSTACYDVETIQITDKYVGFNRYIGGYNFWGTTDKVDSHFVAFNTDKKIEKLLEADVYFQTQGKVSLKGISFEYGEVTDNYSHMTSTTTAVFDGDYNGWLNSSYEWDRIQSVNDFIKSEDFTTTYQMGIFDVSIDYALTDETKQNIASCEWVLRFYESLYSKDLAVTGLTQWTTVSNVSLLRLQFETEGKVYNIGVVDNKQSGDGKLDNQASINVALNWSLFSLLLLAIVTILLLIFAPHILIAIIKFAWKAIKAVCKGFWWVFTSPLILFEKKEIKNG